MSEPRRLIIYNDYAELDSCLIGHWLKAEKRVFWAMPGNMETGTHYDEIIIMPHKPFGRYLDLTPHQQDSVRRFMLQDLPTHLKPGGRIYDLNELTGDLNGQTEPNFSD